MDIRRFKWVLLVVLGGLAVCQLGHSEEDVSEQARLRTYPGGLDEEDLVVQKTLSTVDQKFSKSEIQKSVYESLLKVDEKKSAEE